MRAADGSGDHVDLDVDEVDAVIGFYRRCAQVVEAAASDLGGHAFGAWADPDDDNGHLGARFAEIGQSLGERLRVQAAAAATLADELAGGLGALADADAEAAARLRAAATGVAQT